MRQGLLWLSERQGIFNFVRRNGLARKFASRFVAGETIESGVAAARELSRRGITRSLDLLGESVTAEAEAAAARDLYLAMLDRMAESGVEVNVSVKLTQMGLDIREDLCLANMSAILEQREGARRLRPPRHGRLRLHPANPRLLLPADLFPTYGAHCGVVIQSMLRRSEQDVERPRGDGGAGPPVQGCLPGAGGGRIPRQGRRGSQLRAADGAPPACRQLSRSRHPRRSHHRHARRDFA